MISSETFVLSLGLLLGGLSTWAFKCLPDERWQFLASVPILKDSSGRWHGLNFTYYGLLTANPTSTVRGVDLWNINNLTPKVGTTFPLQRVGAAARGQ